MSKSKINKHKGEMRERLPNCAREKWEVGDLGAAEV